MQRRSHLLMKETSLQVITLNKRPDLLALAQHNPKRYPVLFQSLGQVLPAQSQIKSLAQWDLLSIANGEQIVASDIGRGSFFAELDRCLSKTLQSVDVIDCAPPFIGGWVVYLGYELSDEIEPTLKLPATEFEFPRAFALRTPGVIAIDRLTGIALLVFEAGYDALLGQVEQDLALNLSSLCSAPIAAHITEDAPELFLNSTERVHEYLKAGDVFQANISRGWQARLQQSVSSAQIYANLCAANPAPFAALAQFDQFAIISSSPERLVQSQNSWVQTRPIAGTRARKIGDLPLNDQEKDAFVGDIKERAEHIMLIDLERNDLGRVCVAGSVVVDELLTVESYAHVHHIVSNVAGRLRPDVGPIALLKAVFPGGTITGCPKVRCMEIIAELEQTGRGPYTGALGYINHNGDMDFNILIRTFARVDNTLYFRAGAGIVMDSVSSKELLETRAKAKGMLRAISEIEQ